VAKTDLVHFDHAGGNAFCESCHDPAEFRTYSRDMLIPWTDSSVTRVYIETSEKSLYDTREELVTEHGLDAPSIKLEFWLCAQCMRDWALKLLDAADKAS
jgi:hypothetical protein